jgi:protein-tyrosine-phosphatase
MAEVMFKQLLEEEGVGDWQVLSAGVWAQPGIAATPTAVMAMHERGLNLSTHLSRPVTAELLDEIDVALVMENRHKEALINSFPQFADKIHLLGEMAGLSQEVDDPVGEPLQRYRETARDIHYYLQEALPHMQAMLADQRG